MLLAGKGRLKVVGRAGVGIDNVDLAAATEAGVLVVNAPTANTIAAAEHGIALLCSLSRNVAQADASMKVRTRMRALQLCALRLHVKNVLQMPGPAARAPTPRSPLPVCASER